MGGDEAGLPEAGGVVGGFEEEATLAGGGGEGEELSGGDCEDGAEGEVDVVGETGRLVEDEEGDSREAAGGGVAGGEGDDARAIGERQGVGVAARAGGDAEAGEEEVDLAEEFEGLAEGGGDEEGEGSGRTVEEVVDGEDGGEGGFAPLAGAAEEAAGVGGSEEGVLVGVGNEAEGEAGEPSGVFEAEVVEGGGFGHGGITFRRHFRVGMEVVRWRREASGGGETGSGTGKWWE